MNKKGKGSYMSGGSTYGAGDGDMTPQKANMTAMAKGGGLKGYMSGGGVYDNLVEAQNGIDMSKQTAAQIQAYNSSRGQAPGMTSQGLVDNIKSTMRQNRDENKATRAVRRDTRRAGDSTKTSRQESRAKTAANRAENKVLRQAKTAAKENRRSGY